MMTRIGEKIGLEDGYVDVLGKAQRGLQFSIEELASRTGLSTQTIQAVKDGTVDEDAIRKLAFAMNLHETTLCNMAHNTWYPQEVPPFPGLAMFTTWYGDMTVNAFLIWDPETKEAASFDTGSSCQPMLDHLNANHLALSRIFITHTHMDHLADLETLQGANHQATSYGSAVDNPLGLKPLKPGDGLIVGKLRIRVLGTSGHTPGGLSYFIQGLEHPIVVVGDALFASSQGGAPPHAYEEALRNNREQILSLPENTIICPGHGPLTSVGEEREHNPFFPEFKSAE